MLDQQPDTLMSDIERLLDRSGYSAGTKEYARREFARGVDYYEEFAKRIGWAGSRVLDAGCGVGSWALGLAKCFDQVVALEHHSERLALSRDVFATLGVPNVTTLRGTIEALPFPDKSFDGVFCHGVIFLTDWRKSLAELVRVLVPGGRIYISFDSLPWWDHLIFDRWPDQPMMIPQATAMLHHQALELLSTIKVDKIGRYNRWMLLQRLVQGALVEGPRRSRLLSKENLTGKISRAFSRLALWGIWFSSIAVFGWINSRSETNIHPFSENSPNHEASVRAISVATSRILNYGSRQQRKEILHSLIRIISGTHANVGIVRRGYCIEAWQLRAAFSELGIETLQEGPDTTVNLTKSPLSIRSAYPHNLGVREIVGRKGDWGSDRISSREWLEFFRGRAKWAFDHTIANLVNPVVERVDITMGYDRVISEFYQQLGESLRWSFDIKTLVEDMTSGSTDADEKFLRIYRFVQDALFHHPTIQFRRYDGSIFTDPFTILLSGIGRCGHVAHVAKELFQAAGWPARVTQLDRHVCCEVLYQNRWRLVDADAFKSGLWPKNADGQWATLEEVKRDPALLDSLPAIGHQLSSEAGPAKDQLGRVIDGYVDTGLAWERPYVSAIYFGGTESPPAPPRIVASRSRRSVSVALADISPGTAKVEIWIGRRGRGFSYTDYPDESYMARPDGSIAHLLLEPVNYGNQIIIETDEDIVFINVAAHGKSTAPSTWYWPGRESIV